MLNEVVDLGGHALSMSFWAAAGGLLYSKSIKDQAELKEKTDRLRELRAISLGQQEALSSSGNGDGDGDE